MLNGEGPFYIVEAPMTSEIVACPAAHLRIVAAGNFGRAYQVYDLDPAVRRRFDTVIEFDYLEYRDELALVRREAPDLGARAAEALVKLAQETRRLLANGEMPGCVDTASLLNWAKKCERSSRQLAGQHHAGCKTDLGRHRLRARPHRARQPGRVQGAGRLPLQPGNPVGGCDV